MLLEIDGLCASRAGTEVLHDVRMHLDRGEITASSARTVPASRQRSP